MSQIQKPDDDFVGEQLHMKRNEQGWRAWWLRQTAPKGTLNYEEAPTHAERERLRRAGLTSWLAALVFVAPLLLLQQAMTDRITALGIGILMLSSVLALLLNRSGKQVVAAVLLIGSMDIVIQGALVGAALEEGLSTGWLLTFDLFVLPLIGVGVVLSRKFLVVFATLHCLCILGSVFLLPHAQDLEVLMSIWGGPAIAFARPLLIQVVAGGLCYLSVRSTDQAILRADRAEQLARLEHQVAENLKQIQEAAEQLRIALAEVGKGKYGVRVHVEQGNILWEVGRWFNLLLERLSKTSKADAELHRTKEQLQRLGVALDAAQSGQPVFWPAPGDTDVDRIIERLARQSSSSPSSAQRASGTSASSKIERGYYR